MILKRTSALIKTSESLILDQPKKTQTTHTIVFIHETPLQNFLSIPCITLTIEQISPWFERNEAHTCAIIFDPEILVRPDVTLTHYIKQNYPMTPIIFYPKKTLKPLESIEKGGDGYIPGNATRTGIEAYLYGFLKARGCLE